MRVRRWWMAALAVVVVTVAAVTVTVIRNDAAARQAAVAAQGGKVMPFDLERTTHRFAKAANGGVQTVVADDPSDADQIRLIRDHLKEEYAKFGRGDFGDPAVIHGTQMPGLDALTKGYQRIGTDYADLPDGARITYTTSDSSMVTALHAWFDAQVSEHGSHAEHG